MGAIGSNKERQQAALMGVYFFAGRINARYPGINLGAELKTQAATMGPKDFEAESRRCGAMVVATVQALQAAQTTMGGGRPPAAQAAPGAAPSAARPAQPAPAPSLITPGLPAQNQPPPR